MTSTAVATILNGLVPVVFAMGLGWLAGRLGYMRAEAVEVLATFVLHFGLPAALFLVAATTPPDRLVDPAFVATLTVGMVATFVLALLLGLAGFRHGLRPAAVQALACAFPDMAFFGAPVLAAVIGPEGYISVLVGNLVVGLLLLPATVMLLRFGEDRGGDDHGSAADGLAALLTRGVRHAAAHPLLWMPALGVALSFLDVSLPTSLRGAVDLVGRSTGGLSLFALGLMFCGARVRLDGEIAANIALKTLVQPALMALGAALLGLSGPLAAQAIITGALPTAMIPALLAVQHDAYADKAPATVLATTLVAVVTVSLVIALVVP